MPATDVRWWPSTTIPPAADLHADRVEPQLLDVRETA
jgi:hypothetical protein